MNNVYEELDEARAEIEKLKIELGGKTDSLQTFKKSHDAQVSQIQEAIFKIEKLEQDLILKADEINYAKQIYEDLNGNLNNEESTIKHLSAANDKLGADCDGKFEKWEEVENHEQKMCVYKQESESLKGCLSVSNKKCLEIEKSLKASKELGETDEKHEGVGEQIKGKEEQFKHLEEAHKKLRDQFRSSLKEWELEKSQLLDEISSLQFKLDSHIKISQDMKHQLEMCKQALAHEEIQRKHLEVEVSDLKVQFNHVSSEYQNVRLQLDCLNSQQDKDNENLRFSLKTQEACDKESEYSTEKLEQENHELQMSLKELQEDQIQEAACLMRQIESYGLAKELQHLPQNEIDRHKDMREESTKCKLLKEKVLQVEIDLKEQLKEVYDALYRTNIELEERLCERSEMEFELQICKSFVERLKNDLEENHAMCKELEDSLLAQVEFSESLKQEKDSLVYKLEMEENRIDYLQQHVFLLEQELKVREAEASVSARRETDISSETVEVSYLQIIEEKDKILEEFQKEVLWLEQTSFRREYESSVIAKSNMERTNELEKEHPIQFVKGKNMRIDGLMQQVTSLEQQFNSSLTSFSSQLAEKHAEINQVQEAFDMITAVEVLAGLEIEEKKLMLVELEDDIHDIEQKLKLQEENWSQLKQLALDIEAEMDAKQLKIKELTDQMENKLKGSDFLLQKLKMENSSLVENATRLSPEREHLLGFFPGLGDKMCDCTSTDTQLMDMLRSIVQSFQNDCLGVNFRIVDELLVKENMIMHSPPGINKPETFSDIRPPFKELNN
ncbi:hypothetical protein SESBI_50584 [Sesbania bispinosa]|nr:hypothetical protein SESBI_50584 [Sesbania bispinosa]